jgi:ketosteroid isomerase-like protein
MTTDSEKLEIANKFLTGLRTADRSLHESIMAETVIWSMPGDSLISGDARGIEAIHQRAMAIVGRGMQFELKHILIGRHGVAVYLHNTAQHDGKMFDMYLTTVMTIHERTITALDTYMADIAMLNSFFAAS